jgi:ABC-type methionine transport system permease subunit
MPRVMIATVIILVIMVQLCQIVGDKFASVTRHDRKETAG